MEEKVKDEKRLKKSVEDILHLQAKYYRKRDDCDKNIDAINYILGAEPNNKIKKELNEQNYPYLDFQDLRSLKYTKRMLELVTVENFGLIIKSKEAYAINNLLEIIDKYSSKINTLENLLKKEQIKNKNLEKQIKNKKIEEQINLESKQITVSNNMNSFHGLTVKSNKKCTDKEWQTCQEEKMGCKGCYYNN